MDPGTWLRRQYHALMRSRSPLSLILLGVAVGMFLVGWLGSGSGMLGNLRGLLAFDTSDAWREPWRWVTYVLLNFDLLGILFVGLGLYYFGASIESRWGTPRFGWFFLFQVLAFPILLWLHSIFVREAGGLVGMYLPVCSLLVTWGTLHPSENVLLWFLLPIRGSWIGWITFLGVVFLYGMGSPLRGVLMGVPLVLAWAYASGRFSGWGVSLGGRGSRGARRGVDYEGRDWDRLREVEEERRRLRELFERSWGRDEGDEDGTKSGN